MLKSSGITLSLAVLAIVGALGIDAYLPSLQAIGQSLQADPATVQQTLSISIAMMALTTLFAGTLSDSFGRRPTVMASLPRSPPSSVAGCRPPWAGNRCS